MFMITILIKMIYLFYIKDSNIISLPTEYTTQLTLNQKYMIINVINFFYIKISLNNRSILIFDIYVQRTDFLFWLNIFTHYKFMLPQICNKFWKSLFYIYLILYLFNLFILRYRKFIWIFQHVVLFLHCKMKIHVIIAIKEGIVITWVQQIYGNCINVQDLQIFFPHCLCFPFFLIRIFLP